jgi:hypothetical protein
MTDDDTEQRLARLESLVEDQQDTIEQQRERIAELERQQSGDTDENPLVADGTSVKVLGEIDADGATGVLGRATGSGQTYGVRGEASATGGYGLSTPDDAEVGGRTDLTTLAGDLTGGTDVTDLVGAGLSINSGRLTGTGVADSGTTVRAGVTEIDFGDEFSVVDNEDGSVTVVFESTLRVGPVSYADPSDLTPNRLRPDGTVEEYSTSESASEIGRPTIGITDCIPDLPFTNSGNLIVVDIDGNSQTLDGSGDVKGKSIGVGDWNDDGTVEVLYARTGANNSSNLYTVAPGRSPTDLGFEPRRGMSVGDFDGDGDNEIVMANYDGSNNTLVYTSDGSTLQDTGYDVPDFLGTLADYDDDGTLEMPAIASGIDLVESDGSVTSLSTSYDPSGPVGAMDYTGTGVPDLIHLRDEGTSRDFDHKIYYYDVLDGTTGAVTDGSGNKIDAEVDAGVR